MSKTKNNGIDLGREIIAMTQEYNRVITTRNNEIRALEHEVKYYKRREEAANKSKDELRHDLEIEIEKLRGTLETVTDLICRHIKQHDNKPYIESIGEWENDYHTLISALDITIGVSEVTESEDR